MLEIGSLVDGKYKILNKIGQGGMSTVYLAMNERANKQWAVKEVIKTPGDRMTARFPGVFLIRVRFPICSFFASSLS